MPIATLKTSEPLKVDHDELHHDLWAATRRGGRTGETAQRVARVLLPHFTREEDFAMPPLALLAPLAAGQLSPEMRDILVLTDRLKAELPNMLDEHRVIGEALAELARSAEAEGHFDVVRFAEKLRRHAQLEERVLYPAAILVGEFLKLQLG